MKDSIYNSGVRIIYGTGQLETVVREIERPCSLGWIRNTSCHCRSISSLTAK